MKTLKASFTGLLSIACFTLLQAQCIDESLIDPDAWCQMIYAPVCGCDNVTYENDCIAENSGVTSWTSGECEPTQVECIDESIINLDMMCYDLYEPVCGCDNITYPNDCYATFYGGVTSFTQGECDSAGDNCIDENLIDIDAICFEIYAPVCGCDSVTYDNDCYAVNYGGVTSFTEGPCQTSEPEDCVDLAGVDFGLCDMFLGVAVIDGTCAFVSGCGWEVGGIDYTPYFYESIELCQTTCGTSLPECLDLNGLDFGDCEMDLGVAVVDGQCIAVSGCGYEVGGVNYSSNFFDDIVSCEGHCEALLCINTSLIEPVEFLCGEPLDPVCGCDGNTYANACSAEKEHGITTYSEGPCDCIDESVINEAAYDDCVGVNAEVCGCDGVDYFDPCYAYYFHGVTSVTLGPCIPDNVENIDQIEMQVYPNPTNNNLTIELSQAMPYILRMYDVGGRLLVEVNFTGARFVLEEMAAWPAGYYIAEISGENSIPLRKRIMKK